MLDYYLRKGYVKMKEDGSVVKTPYCPSYLSFREDENGKIIFSEEGLTLDGDLVVGYHHIKVAKNEN